MTKIFISYSRVDSGAIQQFSELLGYGCDVWYDQAPSGIMGGEDWWQRIVSEIETCDHYVYLLSNDSTSSKWCQKELDTAIELDKHIIPVRIRDRTQLPDKISHLHMIDAFGDKLSNGISRIYGSILKNSFDTSYKITDAHRLADLKLITMFWELLPSWYFSRQLEIQLNKGEILHENYSNRIHTFILLADDPIFKFNSRILNGSFETFIEYLNLFVDKVGLEFTTDTRGYLDSNYTWIMAGNSSKISPDSEIQSDQEIIEQKKVGFNKTIELYEEAKTVYLQIINIIRQHYPEFDLLRD